MGVRNFRTPQDAEAAGWPGHTQEDVDRDTTTVGEMVEQDIADPSTPSVPGDDGSGFTWPEGPLEDVPGAEEIGIEDQGSGGAW